jgi:hypothetical protein
LLRERVYAIALGYEDANDLDTLRHDPALKTACEQCPSDANVLASQPTISRMENRVRRADLYRIGMALAKKAVAQLPADTKRVILDMDTTDDPCHGQQELRLFDGHYGSWCFVPLHVHLTDETGRERLMAAVLRSANSASKRGIMGVLKRAVSLIRARFPHAQITVRGDSGFGYGALMNWCDAHAVGYILGLHPSKPLLALTNGIQIRAALLHRVKGDGCRVLDDVLYHGTSWDQPRRVVVKAEAVQGKVEARFVVTSETQETVEAAYARYAQRGNSENRIKEMKLDIKSGRTSCHRFVANQCRLLLHAGAFMLMSLLQDGLQGTHWAKAQVGTLRQRLLKVGARVVQSCRCIWVHMPTAFPEQDAWRLLHQRLLASNVVIT